MPRGVYDRNSKRKAAPKHEVVPFPTKAPAIAETPEPIARDIETLQLRFDAIMRLNPTGPEAVLINDILELPTLAGDVRSKIIDRSIFALRMLRGER